MGCSEKKVEYSFSVIDFSSYNGWTSTYSIKIDSIGQTYIQGEDVKRGKWFIRTEIASEVLDSLCTLVNDIDFTKLDTLYKKKCEDCGYYYLIINQINKTPIKVFVEDNNNNEDLFEVNKLSQYLGLIVRTLRLKMESMQFESRNSYFQSIHPDTEHCK